MSVRNPCYHCGSRLFSFIKRGRFELVSDQKVGFGNVLNPEVALLVCNGCGHTAWFMRDHAEFLEGIQCESRTVPEEQYR